jgi:hypothetical protein
MMVQAKKNTLLFVVIVLLLLGGVAPLRADTTGPHTLLDLLALVPDTTQTRTGVPVVSYVDYRAIEAARGIQTPTAEDFQNQTDLAGLWLAAANGIAAGPEMNYFLQQLGGMQEQVGFTWFDVNQAVAFGNPPSQGTIMAGSFDASKIAVAFQSRGYTQTDVNGIPVWCSADGCDAGAKVNLDKRNPANPFGGALGREEPLAVLPGAVVGSGDYQVVQDAVAAYQKQHFSLADDPDFRAAAEAVTADGTLRQALLVSVKDVGVVDYAQVALKPEILPTLRQQVAGYKTLPPYTLAVFADVWKEKEQIALIGLVYDDADTAKVAGSELAGRMNTFISLVTQRPFSDVLKDVQGSIAAPTVYQSSATGKAVALLALRYPLPSNELSGDPPRYTASSLLFRRIITELYQRGLYPLATELVLPK